MLLLISVVLMIFILIILICWCCIYLRYKIPLRHIKEFTFARRNGFPRDSVDYYNVFKSNVSKFGKNHWMMTGPFAILFTTDPKLYSLILRSPKHINKPILHPLENFLGNSLFTINGREWRKQRTYFNNFFDYSSLTQYMTGFNTHTNQLVKTLELEVDKEASDIQSIIERFFMRMVFDILLGTNINDEDLSKFMSMLKFLTEMVYRKVINIYLFSHFTYIFTSDYWKERQIIKDINDYLKTIIKKRILDQQYITHANNKSFLIDKLLEDMIQNKNITEDYIVRHLIVMIVGAFDTTSQTIGFTLHSLSKSPEIQEKCFKEITTILSADINQSITYQHTRDMNYLDLVIKETLRMYTVAPAFYRQLEENVSFEGITLPKGLTISFLSYVMHLDPDLYPDPEKFIPERFQSDNSFNRFAYAPFCLGARGCIGKKFAEFVMKVVLSKVLLHYKLVDAQHALRLALEMLVVSKTGVKAVIRKR